MMMMIHSSLSWSCTTASITGVAGSWKFHSHAFGLSANAAAGANASAASVAQKAPSLANTIFAPSEVPSPNPHPAARPLSPTGRAMTRGNLHRSFPYHKYPARPLRRLIPGPFRVRARDRWIAVLHPLLLVVIPAKAGIQGSRTRRLSWTPAFAGVTGVGI